jgi:sugar phosphate isomerase/epimerase
VELGIFAKTFPRPSLAGTLDAIVAHGLRTTQFNLACAGLPSLPDALDPAAVAGIRQEFDARQLSMAALSGTFNMIHPDAAVRQAGLRSLEVLASACAPLGTSILTLCTGTRDPDDMWHGHPDNATPAAWRDMLESIEQAVAIAEAHDITLAFEPEPANVIDRPAKARRLLNEMRSPRLKVLIDGANLFHPGDIPRMSEILDEAFALLGPDIVLAHAKELGRDGQVGQAAPGEGCLDFDRYISLLERAGYRGPLIVHGLPEAAVAGGLAFLRGRLA